MCWLACGAFGNPGRPRAARETERVDGLLHAADLEIHLDRVIGVEPHAEHGSGYEGVAIEVVIGRPLRSPPLEPIPEERRLVVLGVDLDGGADRVDGVGGQGGAAEFRLGRRTDGASVVIAAARGNGNQDRENPDPRSG